MSLKRPYLSPLILLFLTNILLVAPVPAGLRYAAALVLLAFLPGWTWLQPGLIEPVTTAERLVLAVGLSLALTIFGTMLAVYLPGPLSLSQLLVVMNGLTLPGL